MKRCPKCNQVYADSAMNFCLTDGTPLSEAFDSERTLTLSSPPATDPSSGSPTVQMPQSSRQGVSPLFAYAAIGLLLLLIGGGIVMWLKWGARSSSTENQNMTPANTNSAPQNLNQMKEESNVNRNEVISKKNETEKPRLQGSSNTAKLYRVVGVAYNDVLYIRPKPGQLDRYVEKIPANGVDIQVLGGDVRVGKSVWVMVNYKGFTGWVNRKFLTEQ